jgi:hypothetical protein
MAPTMIYAAVSMKTTSKSVRQSDPAPPHGSQALLTVHGDDGLDDLARGDVVARMPVDFREPDHAELCGDRFSRTRARDTAAHAPEALRFRSDRREAPAAHFRSESATPCPSCALRASEGVAAVLRGLVAIA